MNENISRLTEISGKKERMILGLMSGTSLDGLDIALCRISGSGLATKVELEQFTTVGYDDNFKQNVRAVFSKKTIDLEQLCLLNPWIGLVHAQMILDTLAKWGVEAKDVDVVASHGQTIYHAPKALHGKSGFPDATLQIGDGDHIAVKTGILTLSDFRQKHIAAGGEGAPLAVYGDLLIFSKAGENRIMLNIGGIANFTSLPGNLDPSLVFSTDVGPGNTMMDALVQLNFKGKYYDEGGAIGLAGKVSTPLLAALKQHPFFEQGFPKTTGPELFNLNYLNEAQQRSASTHLSVHDVMATLARFSAEGIADAVKATCKDNKPYHIYTSGGGMHNPLLMQHLKVLLPNYTFNDTAILGVNPDAKEAVLFAILANECLCGEGIGMGPGTPGVTMGKLSFPL